MKKASQEKAKAEQFIEDLYAAALKKRSEPEENSCPKQ